MTRVPAHYIPDSGAVQVFSPKDEQPAEQGSAMLWHGQGEQNVVKETWMRKKIIGLLVMILLIGGTVAVWTHKERDAMQATSLTAATPKLSLPEAQILYEQARSILDNQAVSNVTPVPKMLEQCALAGHEEASLLLLDVYEGRRKGIEANMRKAAEWADLIARETDNRHLAAEAQYRSARYEERKATRSSLKNAFSRMKEAARMGLPKARVELARYLMFGIGTGHDPKGALAILKSVARQHPDTPNLFFYAGYMHMKGMGIYGGPDYRTALFLYRKGLQWKDPRAINNLAMMYERGLGGLSPDVGKALAYYRMASKLGCREASTNEQRMGYRIKAIVSGTWQQRVARASLRVVQALPIAPFLHDWIEAPLRRIATEL